MTTRPTSDHVYIRRDPDPETTSGGIVIPQDIREMEGRGIHGRGTGAATGTVVAVGPGEWGKRGRKPLELQPGDRVLFEPAAGMTREIDGEALDVMEEGHVLGVVESEGAPAGESDGEAS